MTSPRIYRSRDGIGPILQGSLAKLIRTDKAARAVSAPRHIVSHHCERPVLFSMWTENETNMILLYYHYTCVWLVLSIPPYRIRVFIDSGIVRLRRVHCDVSKAETAPASLAPDLSSHTVDALRRRRSDRDPANGIGGRMARNYCHHNVRRDAWRCSRRAVSWRPRRNFTYTRLKLTFLRRKKKHGHNRKYLLSPPT